MSKLKRRRQDGAVALEAALVTPILLILVFGIIEFSFAMRDYVVVVSDARVGARIASAGASFGEGLKCSDDPELPCVASTRVPALAQAAAKAIQTSGSAMPVDNINYILVYRAEDNGRPVGSASSSECGPTDCVKFTWRKSTDSFKWAGGSWDHKQISACFPGTPAKPLQKVGVHVNTTHKGITGIFFKELTLEDTAVLNFEPLPVAACGKGER